MQLEQTFEPQGWGPSDPKWIDNRTILLTKKRPLTAQGEPRTASLTLDPSGNWRLE
jgi:hypothetical protein